MKGRRYHFNIDRLEVCYTASREVMDSLEDTAFWEREGYRLQEFSRDRIETTLRIDTLVPGADGRWEVFAWLRIGNRFEREEDATRFCWIRLENKALYTKGKEYGELAYLYWIADDLGLQFNNITYLELALDSSVNMFRRVRSALRTEGMVPIILGKAYPKMREEINKLLYIHTGDRMRYRSSTILLKSANDDMSLQIYDKAKEIEESGKEYIRECFGLPGSLFRMEVRLRNCALADYCTSIGCTQYDVYMRLLDGSFLFDLWLHQCDKLMRFREKRSKVSLVQL